MLEVRPKWAQSDPQTTQKRPEATCIRQKWFPNAFRVTLKRSQSDLKVLIFRFSCLHHANFATSDADFGASDVDFNASDANFNGSDADFASQTTLIGPKSPQCDVKVTSKWPQTYPSFL